MFEKHATFITELFTEKQNNDEATAQVALI
jgi:hypothetical protein